MKKTKFISFILTMLLASLAPSLNAIAEEAKESIEVYDESGKEQTGLVSVWTQDDLYVLAHVICGEAQCYSDMEQLYVGSVVLNRVMHPDYPNTIRDVVYQKGQYACVRDGNYDRTPTERNWKNARYLLNNGSILPASVVYQSGGKQGKGVYIKTSKHYYCYK